MCDKYLVQIETALNLWVEDMNEKHVLIDNRMLHQKALSLQEDFGKGSPGMNDGKAFIAS